MTRDEKDLSIRVLQFGFATGATHRFECLRVFIQSHPELKEAAIAACAAFERGCGYCPELANNLEQMSDAEFFGYVIRHRDRAVAV